MSVEATSSVPAVTPSPVQDATSQGVTPPIKPEVTEPVAVTPSVDATPSELGKQLDVVA